MMLNALLADSTVTEVHALSRRPLAVDNPKLQVHLVDFCNLPVLPQFDEIYLALGTTIKVAGSKAAFRAVDFDANLAVAHAAFASGARRVGLVSAGASSAKSAMFYNRVKGELEDALKAIPFTALVIAQPSLLLDCRDGLGQPVRYGEIIAIPIAKLIAPLLPGAYKPVRARSVAHALVRTVPTAQGVVTLPSDLLSIIGADRS
jgi:uncharacterized protein YbjT (DUF2867 family)